MPPHKPIEDIDFLDLRDKLLELLYAIWTFICEICVSLWSTVCQAFWTAWTWPPFETFRNELVAALIALYEYAVAHPVTTAAILILAYNLVPCVFGTFWVSLLHCLGFRRQGVLRGSYAANYQSISHGNVLRGSTFSKFQSQGARSGSGYRGANWN